MYLLINLSKKDIIQLSLFNSSQRTDKKFSGQNRELLFSIDKFFKEEDLDKKDIKGIMVAVGEGGFTSTRLAVTVANTFGYVLQIPLLAISSDQTNKVKDLIPDLIKQSIGIYISAEYSGVPNIGYPQEK